MINPPPPPKPPTPHKEMLKSTFALPNGYSKPVIETKEPAVTTLVKTEDSPEEKKTPDKSIEDNEQHTDDQKHKDKCTICQSKVVKPIVETDISRAASSFAKDSTLIKYRLVQY